MFKKINCSTTQLPFCFAFIKSEFFLLNIFNKKAFIRKQTNQRYLVDTFSSIFSFKKSKRIQFFSIVRQFFFIYFFHKTKLIRFFDILPQRRFVYNNFNFIFLFVRYSFYLNFKDIFVLERILGGYICLVRGKLCFISFRSFHMHPFIWDRHKFFFFPVILLKIKRKRKMRRNFFKYKKLFRRRLRNLNKIKNINIYSKERLHLHVLLPASNTLKHWFFFLE